MAVEKSLNTYATTPQKSLKKTAEENQFSMNDPYTVSEYDDGSKEFDFDPDLKALTNEGVVNITDEHFENLAESIEDETVLNQIGAQVQQRYKDDKASFAEHLQTVTNGMSLLGTKIEEINDPFPGACAAHHPLILESAVKFQAKASNELFSSKGPVKTAIIGKANEDKELQAKRVKEHMNYQIQFEMEEYFDETEMLLFYLPIIGSGFKKIYYDAQLDRPVSIFVPIDQFVVNYYASNLKTAYCYTHVIQRNYNDLLKDIEAGLYRECDLKNTHRTEYTELTAKIDSQQGFSANQADQVMTILEQACCLDLKEDPLRSKTGVHLPYVVSIENESGKVLSIRRNWKKEDPKKKALCSFVHYKFVPGLGFYGLGYIHLLGNLQMTLTSAMRTLIDSGTFATLQGGFVDKRLRIRENDGPLAPGQYKEVEAGGLELDKAIKLIPSKEPSPTLLSMYQFIEQRGQKFADSMEQVLADSTNYGPVGTTMALLEASQKFFTGVHKRLHKSQKQEFSILASINYEFLEESESFDTVGNSFEIRKEDYDGLIDVVPVSDPNLGSQAQKLTLADAIKNSALQAPQIHDMREVSKYYYNSLGIDEFFIDKFLPNPDEPQQNDPITDLILCQKGKPIAAFQGQDHDSHIAVKQAFLSDPMSGGSPAMQPVAPKVMANIQEHMVLKFQESVAGTVAGEQQTGAPTEAIVTQAAQKVAQQNQRILELEQQSPDTARAKLADAEVQRVINETRELEQTIEDKVYERSFNNLKLEFDKYKTELQEQNKLLIAQLASQAQEHQLRLKEMSDLMKEAAQINHAHELKDQEIEGQIAVEKAKPKPVKPPAKPKKT